MIKLKHDLFTMAKMQLDKEKEEGIIPCYTMRDVIEYAVKIRRFLDEHPTGIKKIMELSTKQKKINRKEVNKRDYLKRSRKCIK